MKKTILLLLVFVLIIIVLSGCMGMKKNKSDINQKVDTEISFLDNELLLIANSINGIDYYNYKIEVQEVKKESSQSNSSESDKSSDKESGQSSGNQGDSSENKQSKEEKTEKFSLSPNTIIGAEKEVDWEELTKKVELFYSAWITISKDLRQVGVDENKIIEFDKNIDLLAVSIKNKDTNSTLENTVKLYAFLPQFADYKEQNKNKRILESKYYLLVCYNNVNREDWEQFSKSITDLKMNFSNISNQKSTYKGQEVNIDSISAIIKEMENTVELKEKEIFFVKYKNMLQELNIICTN